MKHECPGVQSWALAEHDSMNRVEHDSPKSKRPSITDVPVAPVTVSQRTCLAILGIESRPFREAVHKYGIRHTKLGNLLVVRVADFLDALERIGGHASNDATPDDGTPIMSVDQMLARVGHARVGGGR